MYLIVQGFEFLFRLVRDLGAAKRRRRLALAVRGTTPRLLPENDGVILPLAVLDLHHGTHHPTKTTPTKLFDGFARVRNVTLLII